MNKGEQIYQIKQSLKRLFSLTEEKVQEDTEMGKKMFRLTRVSCKKTIYR